MVVNKFNSEEIGKMAKVNVIAAGIGLMVLAVVPVLAHHSFSAEFDASKSVNFTGTVTKVEWTNPHSWFYIDVKDPETGKVENWGFETGNPVALLRQGWTRDTMKIGMVVTVEGTRAKDGTNRGNARNILVNGKKLSAASSEGTNP
jgi:hypothetical protein